MAKPDTHTSLLRCSKYLIHHFLTNQNCSEGDLGFLQRTFLSGEALGRIPGQPGGSVINGSCGRVEHLSGKKERYSFSQWVGIDVI